MEKCPKCASYNTRRSIGQYDSGRKRRIRPFYSWFRCRECGARFFAVDHLLIQNSLTGLIALVVVVGIVLWAGRPPPAAEKPAAAAQSTAPPPSSQSLAEALTAPTDASDRVTRESAEAGDASAQYLLGLAIAEQAWQQGEQLSFREAAEWLQMAAEQGHAPAQFVLGVLYEKGRGVIQDFTHAVRWFTRASRQGHALAMAQLGRMHKTGRGADKDLVEAYVWLNLASARGDQGAETDRDRLHTLLTTEQIREAQQRSRRLDQELPQIRDSAPPLPAGF